VEKRESPCWKLSRKSSGHTFPGIPGGSFWGRYRRPKGDVFGVSRGLSPCFPGRVKNSPLAESTIVGVSIGRALSGDRPVAFLQFSDFMPVAYNQIFSELACMYWRTDGSWQAPVILMVTCGGYRPGLGPFHASTMEALAAHTPGLDVFMPSTAADAAGLLNAAFESGRPTVFFYPKTVRTIGNTRSWENRRNCSFPPGKHGSSDLAIE
jgi:2-oxoisovalerate dehydrogenase E1 component